MSLSDDDLFDTRFLSRLEQVRLQVRKRFAGTLRAERRSRRPGSSLEFADFRNYVPGDDPRRIDWSIYGRVERLVMKLYEEEEDLDVGILIDCSASMHWRPPDAPHVTKFSLARQLAAALAYFALHGLDHVALWFFDSALRAESGHYRGKTAFHEVLRFLRAKTNRRGNRLICQPRTLWTQPAPAWPCHCPERLPRCGGIRTWLECACRPPFRIASRARDGSRGV